MQAILGETSLDRAQHPSPKRPRTKLEPNPNQALEQRQQIQPVAVKLEAATVGRTQFYPSSAAAPCPTQAGGSVHAATCSQAVQQRPGTPGSSGKTVACNSSNDPRAPAPNIKPFSAPERRQQQQHSSATRRPWAHAASFPAASVWHTVLRQREAYDFIDGSPEPLRSTLKVFAEEVAADGRRRFIVTTPERMWEEYERLQASERHHYEIIREGCPCHLYFDLEYMRLHNPGLDGDAMVQTLVEVVAELLKECFGFVLKLDWVLELDSSTDTKFSRHVVVKVKRAAFQDNMHVKAFVTRVVDRIKDRGNTQARFADFTVSKGPRKPAEPAEGGSQAQQEAAEGWLAATDFFIDTSVYSRNRAFRLFLSSKFGKQAILRATDRFGFSSITGITTPGLSMTPAATGPGASVVKTCGKAEQDLFFSSLICYIDPKWGAVASKGSIKMLRLPEAEVQHQGDQQGPGAPGAVRASSAPTTLHYGGALLPLLDAFMQSICFQGGMLGRVRSWSYLAGTSNLLVNIKDNRWCGNIQAQHKSNGIYYLIDVQDGTWHQRCYDPCCRTYRSAAMPLPKDIWDYLQKDVAQLGQEPQQGQLPLLSAAASALGSKGHDGGQADWAAGSWGWQGSAGRSSSQEDELLCQALDDFDARMCQGASISS